MLLQWLVWLEWWPAVMNNQEHLGSLVWAGVRQAVLGHPETLHSRVRCRLAFTSHRADFSCRLDSKSRKVVDFSRLGGRSNMREEASSIQLATARRMAAFSRCRVFSHLTEVFSKLATFSSRSSLVVFSACRTSISNPAPVQQVFPVRNGAIRAELVCTRAARFQKHR
mmetsp:Transcript_11350/g.25222  ORF Transcript_11350/g.25222 Transcript_11350/m.25222 type:complete len:168 (+) Transcript_11350:956-1459(+)